MNGRIELRSFKISVLVLFGVIEEDEDEEDEDDEDEDEEEDVEEDEEDNDDWSLLLFG
jgi:hypothetical protein